VGIALVILGVPPTTVVGILGIFVIVLAIALQQSLGNLAASVNFLLFKPFVIGDLIETGGVLGVVQEIQLFSVVLISGDNKTHVLPSSKIQGDGLTNYSKIGTLRVDLVIGVSYESDTSQAIQIITNLLTADDRVLSEPPPQVFVQNLADSSVEIAAWPFVKIADFFPFRREITGKVKDSLDAAGIVIPYPQHDVHLITGDQES
jgi:small conductance mechanosensitive channel